MSSWSMYKSSFHKKIYLGNLKCLWNPWFFRILLFLNIRRTCYTFWNQNVETLMTISRLLVLLCQCDLFFDNLELNLSKKTKYFSPSTRKGRNVWSLKCFMLLRKFPTLMLINYRPSHTDTQCFSVEMPTFLTHQQELKCVFSAR